MTQSEKFHSFQQEKKTQRDFWQKVLSCHKFISHLFSNLFPIKEWDAFRIVDGAINNVMSDCFVWQSSHFKRENCLEIVRRHRTAKTTKQSAANVFMCIPVSLRSNGHIRCASKPRMSNVSSDNAEDCLDCVDVLAWNSICRHSICDKNLIIIDSKFNSYQNTSVVLTIAFDGFKVHAWIIFSANQIDQYH